MASEQNFGPTFFFPRPSQLLSQLRKHVATDESAEGSGFQYQEHHRGGTLGKKRDSQGRVKAAAAAAARDDRAVNAEKYRLGGMLLNYQARGGMP